MKAKDFKIGQNVVARLNNGKPSVAPIGEIIYYNDYQGDEVVVVIWPDDCGRVSNENANDLVKV